MGLGSRISQANFAQIKNARIPRSKFNRSFGKKMTVDFDNLNPCFVEEVLPGDVFNTRVNAFIRLSSQALKAPVMDNMWCEWEFFFVPNRLVWSNWEKMNGAQDNPGDSTDYIAPKMTFPAGGPEVGSVFDMLGMPTDIAAGYTINNTLPLRAILKIYNDWYRDENLQDSIPVPIDDGPDVPADFPLLPSGKRHDQFTSALPFLQKGPAVQLPLGTVAPVTGIGKLNTTFGQAGSTYRETGGTTFNTNYRVIGDSSAEGTFAVEQEGSTGNPNIYADLSNATAATINQLREAFQMQALFELDARGGTRYVEILLAHFGVVSPDFRLQRSEYLGGGKLRINTHPVAQTSPTSGSNALGQLGAFGTASETNFGIGFSKGFVEHGYVLGFMRARADLTYQQGINRMWMRSTRFDWFLPTLQRLGEQAILNEEIYVQGTAADKLAFGYQERNYDYRYRPSEITGEFRSTFATSLDYYHMGEEFAALPVLNDEFIVSNTPIERALAVTTGPDLLCDLWFQHICARPMVSYPTPLSLGGGRF